MRRGGACQKCLFITFILPPQPWSLSLSSKVDHSSLSVSEALHPCLQRSTTLYDRYRFLCLFPFPTAAAQRWELGPAHLCPQDLLQCSGHSSWRGCVQPEVVPLPCGMWAGPSWWYPDGILYCSGHLEWQEVPWVDMEWAVPMNLTPSLLLVFAV